MPGPRTILFFLQRDPEALALGVPLPRSTRTIWKVLRAHGRIATDLPHQHRPLDPPAPLAEVQADFTDIGTIPAEPEGKRLHAVEACLFEEVGRSPVPSVEIRSDFHAETARSAVITCLRRTGLMGKLTGLPRSALGGLAQRAGFQERVDSLPALSRDRAQRLPASATR